MQGDGGDLQAPSARRLLSNNMAEHAAGVLQATHPLARFDHMPALRNHAAPIAEAVWEIPTTAKPGMRVPARIHATRDLFEQMDDGVFEQVTNVAMLPGIVGHALCMPDGHW